MKVTEDELIAHSKAPRVTEKELESNIVAVNYRNVGDAVCKANQPDHASHHLLTICVLVLRNGFTVTGESACASPENYDRDIGNRIAYENAKSKVWALMGYSLRDHLTYRGQSYWNQPAGEE